MSEDGQKELLELRAKATACTDCDLYARATQTVFGEGPADAHKLPQDGPAANPVLFAARCRRYSHDQTMG